MLGHPIRLPATLLRRFCSTLFFVALASPAMAQTLNPDLNELEDKITEIVDASEMVGVQVALVDASGAFWARSFGYEDIERTRPLRNDSIMRAGSLSKSLTGALSQILVEEGVIDMNMPLRDALPDLRFENRWEETHPVRLVHLAEHTTGWDDSQFSEIQNFGRDVSPMDGLAINPKSRRSRWQPGRYVAYCNTGPTALAAAMVAQSGEDFDILMQTRLLGPLGMTNSSFLKTDTVTQKLVPSYEGGQEVDYYQIGYRPSGALNTTATELAKFVAMLIGDGQFQGAEILLPTSVARMERSESSLAGQQPGLKGGNGVGLYPRYSQGHIYFGHTGAIDGFESIFSYLPDNGLGYVVMTNQSDGDAYAAIRNLLTNLIEADVAKPSVPEPDPSLDLSQYDGTYKVITQRYGFSALLDSLLGPIKITSEDQILAIKSLFGEQERFVSVGQNAFRNEDKILPSHVFVKTDTGSMEMLERFDTAYRKVSPIRAYAPAAILALFVCAGLIGLLSAILWAVLRPFGAFKKTRFWAVWWAPLLSFVCLFTLFGSFAYGLAGRFDHIVASLGRPSVSSLLIMISGLLLPLFAASGLWRVIVVNDAGRVARIGAGILSVTAIMFSIVLFINGWVGLSIWSYTPPMAG
jgi:CubicO group peptidase (beta-lactamase class C family)